MRLGDVGAHALSNLSRHKLRTVLTLCGVGVGVATLTVMVSLGEGIKRLIESQVDKAELVTRITVLPEGTTSQFFRRPPGPGGQEQEATRGPKITQELIDELEKVPGVVVAYPDLHSPVIGVELEGQIFPAESEGIPAAAITDNYTNALLAGRYWTAAEDSHPVVVAPSSVLEDLGIKPQDVVGKKVYFTRFDHLRRYEMVPDEATPPPATPESPPAPVRVKFVRPPNLDLVEAEVIGVYSSQDFGLAGKRFQAPLDFGKRLLKESGFDRLGALGNRVPQGEYRALTVKVERRTDVRGVRDLIEKKGFDTFAVEDVLKFVAIVFAVIDVLLSFFGGIGLVVSFFGIANTMIMAVLERTREIGVLKALGARDRDVRRVFLAEAAAIGITGGALGVLFGLGVGKGLNALASYVMAEQLNGRGVEIFYVPLWLGLAGIGLSTIVATVAGLYPAWRAARLDPVVSLRME